MYALLVFTCFLFLTGCAPRQNIVIKEYLYQPTSCSLLTSMYGSSTSLSFGGLTGRADYELTPSATTILERKLCAQLTEEKIQNSKIKAVRVHNTTLDTTAGWNHVDAHFTYIGSIVYTDKEVPFEIANTIRSEGGLGPSKMKGVFLQSVDALALDLLKVFN